MSTTALVPRTTSPTPNPADAQPARIPRARRTASLDLPPTASAATVVDAAAAHRDLWTAHVRFDPIAPHHVVVWRDRRWEIVLGAWLPGQSSATVEQLGLPGALHVLSGELEETTWATATDGPAPGRRHAVTRRYAVGATRSHGAVHVHGVRNPGPDPAIALSVRTRA